MKPGSPVKQDLGWCPEGKPGTKGDSMSFKGPFRHVSACVEKSGHNRKDRLGLMLLTRSMMIIMPVPQAYLRADQTRGETAQESRRTKPGMRQLFSSDHDSRMLERLEHLVREYREKEPGEICIAGQDTNTIPLDTITGITITWTSSAGRYSRFLFPFSLYPAEPANAGYRANFQLAVTAGKKSVIVITPFSPELRMTLRDLAGEKVHEIPDENAPLL